MNIHFHMHDYTGATVYQGGDGPAMRAPGPSYRDDGPRFPHGGGGFSRGGVY